MPRGAAVWSQFGESYAQSAGSPYDNKPVSPISQQPTQQAAGAPASLPQRGAGSFINQNSWSLQSTSALTNQLQQATESKTHYRPPPDGCERRAPARMEHGDFPKPDYPNDNKTSYQASFSKAQLDAAAQPTRAVKPKDAERLLPYDVVPQFTTQAQADFSRKQPEAKMHAGHPSTTKPAYNIITGGAALASNVFEAWDGRNYLKRRQ